VEIEVRVEKYNGILKNDNMKIATLKPKESFTVRISGKELNVVKFSGMTEPLEDKLKRLILKRAIESI
jgi:molecular chaperone DnaK (HSP70)